MTTIFFLLKYIRYKRRWWQWHSRDDTMTTML